MFFIEVNVGQKKYRGVSPAFIPRVAILILSSISCSHYSGKKKDTID